MYDTTLFIEDLTPEQVRRLQSEDRILLVDVREPHEHQQTRIPGAVLRPLSTLDIAALPCDGRRRLVFQCGSGKRSRNAAEAFARAAGGESAHLAGGMAAWCEAGFETLRGE